MAPKKFKWRRTNVKEFLCVVPAVVMVIVTTYYPLVDLVRISFTDWDMLKKDYQYVGLTNWVWFVKNASRNHFFADMKVTLIYTFFTLLISLVLGMLLALLMGRMTRPFGMMRAVIFMPRYVAMSTAGIIIPEPVRRVPKAGFGGDCFIEAFFHAILPMMGHLYEIRMQRFSRNRL